MPRSVRTSRIDTRIPCLRHSRDFQARKVSMPSENGFTSGVKLD